MPPRRPKPKHKAGRPLTFADMMRIERVGETSVSPDGRQVAYVRRRVDSAANRLRSSIYLCSLETGEERELTPGSGSHAQPAFSPDGQHLALVSDRDSHGAQLWLLPLQGGEARRITSGTGGVESPCWAPDSRRVAFAREVIVSPHLEAKAGKTKGAAPAQDPSTAVIHGLVNEHSSARVAESLLFRHWDRWRDCRRKHVFVVDVESGKLADITPGDWDAPPISLGSSRDFDFSPDGRELAFVANPDEVVARSTNNCIFVQPLAGVRAKGAPRCISISEACDSQPRYTPDGRTIFYLAMDVPGYEADRQRIAAYDRRSEETQHYLERFDRSPGGFLLAPAAADGSTPALLFAADDRGYHTLYRLDLESGRVRQLTFASTNALRATLPDGRLLVGRQSTTAPQDLFVLEPTQGITPILRAGPVEEAAPKPPADDAGASVRAITTTGAALDGVAMESAEEFWFAGADETPVHGFLVKPPGFTAKRRYPLILLIHGGPQGAFGDTFHYRWNAQLFASQGAVVAMINPRGSTGYGQRFTDQISGDWHGRAYQDLLRGIDHLVTNYRYIDGKRLAAAGASFGGYMVNWICGHTDRFRALVSHDGVFNAETMAYTTEELWFDEHEHGGLPHVRRRAYQESSPHLHVANFKTPTLVVQGEQDFRCPVSEGLGLFTALQVMGVPSRYLHFPDEGHWVQKPANAEVWYHEVLDWLYRWLA